MFQLFDVLIIPILTYGAEIWGCSNIYDVEFFYKKFIKNSLKLNLQTADCMVYGESGRLPIRYYTDIKIINYWYRVATSNSNKLSNIMYRLVRVMHERRILHSPWIYYIKKVLNECGMGIDWNSPSDCNSNWLNKALKLRLSDIFKQNWHISINEMSSCINYRLFKQNHIFEKYLEILEPINRISFARFRCGNSKIPVVLGRYNNQPIDECVCNLCNSGDVGDEFHYIMKCTFFERDRVNLIPRYYWRNPNAITFESLFCSKNKNVLIKISKFISLIVSRFG